MKEQLETYCEEYWWNCGKKTLSFKGSLKELLKKHKITFRKRKTKTEGIHMFYFISSYDVRFKATGQIHDFSHLAKQFIQMELVRMGDKSTLYVNGCWRSQVTVNH